MVPPIMAVGIFAFGIYGMKKFDDQLKELGLKKKDIKILLGMILVYFLYRHYNRTMIRTEALMARRRHLFELERN